MTPNKSTIDAAAAEAYERYMLPGLQGPWARKLVELADPSPGEQVIDAACGTGIGARLAAERVGPSGRVVGVDLEPAMVELAARLDKKVAKSAWHCASVLEMPLPDEQFDLCLCLQGLQFFPDRLAGLREMRRVLKSSGRLFASMWASLETSPAHHALVRALERQGVDTAAARKGWSFSDPEAIRSAASAAGFRRVELRTEEGCGSFSTIQAFLAAIAAGSPSARFSLAKLADSGRREFIEDMEEMLSPYVDSSGFIWPMRANVLIAFH
jgi:ubiquinone/menaquinone biosynthesis C-methylase UbiE